MFFNRFVAAKFALCLVLFVSINPVFAKNRSHSIAKIIANDLDSFYSGKRLKRLGVGFAVGAAIAHSDVDQDFRDWYQTEVRSHTKDNFSVPTKALGEKGYLVPTALLSASLKFLDEDSKIGDWGIQTTRAYLTGTPAMLLMQKVTGGSRPEESFDSAEWDSFDDANGVSGHSFVGAVPFITLAKMNEDRPFVKYLAYAASIAPAWSRVNDDAHYLSQVALGWYMAYESVNAVHESNRELNNYSLMPTVTEDGFGISFRIEW